MSLPTRPKILPPVYLLATLLLMVILHFFLPVAQADSLVLKIIGAVLMVSGIAMAAVSAGAFVKAKTPVIPFEPTTAVITTGLYRFTRNPMYLGMVLVLLGVASLLGSLSPIIPIPVFVVIIHNLFIRREEIFLEKLFGDEYTNYKATVRRWL